MTFVGVPTKWGLPARAAVAPRVTAKKAPSVTRDARLNICPPSGLRLPSDRGAGEAEALLPLSWMRDLEFTRLRSGRCPAGAEPLVGDVTSTRRLRSCDQPGEGGRPARSRSEARLAPIRSVTDEFPLHVDPGTPPAHRFAETTR